jgi:signal recognition particle subunit SRP54
MLGMGDVLSLIEKAEQAIDQTEAEQLEEKLRKNQFTLDDFRKQLKTIKRMGPLESVLGMIPGMGNLKQLAENKPDEKQLGRVEAIISSMTPEERRNESLLNGSRRKRIARGSGTSVEEVNRLVKQFGEMKRVLQMMGGMQAMQQGGKKMMPSAQQMQQLQQMRKGGGGFPMDKKRKKGGPWGLIKTR